MRLGCCGKIEDIDEIHGAGFDFIEVGVQPVLRGDEPDEQWRENAPDPEKLPIPIEAANSLLPTHHAVVGDDRDLDGLRTYMTRVVERAAHLGIERLVLGSGKARLRPKEMSEGEAMDQLTEFCLMAGEICARHKVMLVIEHLHKGETNTINSLEDELILIERVDNPWVRGLVDSYHFGLEQESDEAIVRLGDYVRHVHVAEVVDRLEPGGHGKSDQAFDFESFFCTLRKVGYRERVSIEARWSAPVSEAGPGAIELLRRTWLAAGRCDT